MRKLVILLLAGCILSGCSSSSRVVERKLEVTLPALKDTVAADTLIREITINNEAFLDTIFQGAFFRKGSKAEKDTAAIAMFIPRTGDFIIDIPEHKETVIVKDTIRISGFDAIPETDDPTERIIWIISVTLTSLFLILYKRKLNK